MLKLCSIDAVVSNAGGILQLLERLVGRDLKNALLRVSIFSHFCAGEDEASVRPTVESLRAAGVEAGVALLRPSAALSAALLQPSDEDLKINIPEYESEIDHQGIISDWNNDSLKRGRAIYQGLCVNCHGTIEKPGSLPTSLRFASGQFKFGNDPYSMYQTLTHGVHCTPRGSERRSV